MSHLAGLEGLELRSRTAQTRTQPDTLHSRLFALRHPKRPRRAACPPASIAATGAKLDCQHAYAPLASSQQHEGGWRQQQQPPQTCSEAMRPAALLALIVSACPVFLLGSGVVLVTYQLRLGWHQGGIDSAGADGDLGTLGAAAQLTAQQQQQQLLPQVQQQHIQQQVEAAVDTLVVYVYNEDDPEHAANLAHFLAAAAPARPSRARTVILVQEASLRSPVGPAEALPWLRVVYYAGACHEWGMLGWLLAESGKVAGWEAMAYFVLLNSAVRGPFLPTHVAGAMHWTEPFLSRLTGHVKLVGSSIVCGGAPAQPGNVSAPWRRHPHVPSSALALDREGLQLLLGGGEVLACHASPWAAAYHSEVGASAALLGAGYAIDSLMIRYQGVDWSQPSAWGCNRASDPGGTGDAPYDGLPLDPLEVLFVRVNSLLLQQRQPAALRAAQYAAWAAERAAQDAGALVPANGSARVSGNAYKADRGRFRLPRIMAMLMRGIRCFDVPFYKAHNSDILTHAAAQVAWKFFVYLGQFEDRPFRLTCAANFSAVALPAGQR